MLKLTAIDMNDPKHYDKEYWKRRNEENDALDRIIEDGYEKQYRKDNGYWPGSPPWDRIDD